MGIDLTGLVTEQTCSKNKESITYFRVGIPHANVNFRFKFIGIDANECTGQDLSDVSSIGFAGNQEKSTKKQLVPLGALARSTTWRKRSYKQPTTVAATPHQTLIFNRNSF